MIERFHLLMRHQIVHSRVRWARICLASLQPRAVRSGNHSEPRAYFADARLSDTTVGIGHLNITASHLLYYIALFLTLRLLLMRLVTSLILRHFLHNVIGDGACPARAPRLRALGTMPDIRV